MPPSRSVAQPGLERALRHEAPGTTPRRSRKRHDGDRDRHDDDRDPPVPPDPPHVDRQVERRRRRRARSTCVSDHGIATAGHEHRRATGPELLAGHERAPRARRDRRLQRRSQRTGRHAEGHAPARRRRSPLWGPSVLQPMPSREALEEDDHRHSIRTTPQTMSAVRTRSLLGRRVADRARAAAPTAGGAAPRCDFLSRPPLGSSGPCAWPPLSSTHFDVLGPGLRTRASSAPLTRCTPELRRLDDLLQHPW